MSEIEHELITYVHTSLSVTGFAKRDHILPKSYISCALVVAGHIDLG